MGVKRDIRDKWYHMAWEELGLSENEQRVEAHECSVLLTNCSHASTKNLTSPRRLSNATKGSDMRLLTII